MTKIELLKKVKTSLGNPPDEMDSTILELIDETINYMVSAGVPITHLDVENDNVNKLCSGVIARGVTDLWNYGNSDTKLSEYFYQRVDQLRHDFAVIYNE